MSGLSCPSCGADVPLRSSAPYAVCGYCQSIIMRSGAAPEAIGKTAVLPFDVSPIQIGTTLQADGLSFEVVGRVRWGWAQGSWNEWLLRGSDGSQRWLGEAMGMFMLTAERPDLLDQRIALAFNETGVVEINDRLDADGESFAAADIKQAHCLGGEGELPFPTPTDWSMVSVDFRTTDGSALSMQRDELGTTIWHGRYIELESMRPRNLRILEGWTMPGTLK